MTIREAIISDINNDTLAYFQSQNLLANFAQLYLMIVSEKLMLPRPEIKVGDKVDDDGKPISNPTVYDVLHFAHSIAGVPLFMSFSGFLKHFLELDTETFCDDNSDEFTSFIDLEFMVKAWNDFASKKLEEA